MLPHFRTREVVNSNISVIHILHLTLYQKKIVNGFMSSSHMGSVNWLLKHGVYQDWQPVAEDEVSDEESSTHSPHQPQQVEGVQTGPLRHTGLASLD